MNETSPSSARHGSSGPVVRRHLKRGWLVGLAGALALIGGVVLSVKVFGAGPVRPASASRSAPGTVEEFHYLAAQSTNYCGLRPEGIASHAKSGRLQGSCCTAMDLATYQAQVRQLREYRAISVIPKDPYDIPVP